jgi:hypothetical protein
LKIFSRHGTEAASLRMVAVEARLGIGTVQRHFAGKAGLIQAVDAHVISVIAAAMTEPRSDQGTDPIADVGQRVTALISERPYVIDYLGDRIGDLRRSRRDWQVALGTVACSATRPGRPRRRVGGAQSADLGLGHRHIACTHCQAYCWTIQHTSSAKPLGERGQHVDPRGAVPCRICSAVVLSRQFVRPQHSSGGLPRETLRGNAIWSAACG